MYGFTFGADQEAVVVEVASGKPVPAHRFFPPKEEALRCTSVLKGHNLLYRDGYMVEFGPGPSYCRAHIGENTRRLLKLAQKTIGPKYGIRFTSAVPIDLADLGGAPDDVLRFGCEPSLNAYKNGPQYVALAAETHPWRYAAGHLHISGAVINRILESEKDTRLLVKMWDRHVALPLMVLFPNKEQFLRRKYYGKAGEYRVQKYPEGVVGLEYRTPGPELWQAMPSIGLAYGLLAWVAQDFENLKATWNPLLENPTRLALATGKNAKNLLPLCKPGYSPDLLFRLSGTFNGLDLRANPQEFHSGWGEFVLHLGFKVGEGWE